MEKRYRFVVSYGEASCSLNRTGWISDRTETLEEKAHVAFLSAKFTPDAGSSGRLLLTAATRCVSSASSVGRR